MQGLELKLLLKDGQAEASQGGRTTAGRGSTAAAQRQRRPEARGCGCGPRGAHSGGTVKNGQHTRDDRSMLLPQVKKDVEQPVRGRCDSHVVACLQHAEQGRLRKTLLRGRRPRNRWPRAGRIFFRAGAGPVPGGGTQTRHGDARWPGTWSGTRDVVVPQEGDRVAGLCL